jgi:uncharacterized membrane protein
MTWRLNMNKFTTKFNLGLPKVSDSALNSFLTVFLVIAILGAFGTLGYAIAVPKIGERFTEFYILGINGKAEDYPTEYVMNDSQITQVIYGDGTLDANHGWGTVTLGIVNHEQQTDVYSVKMTIDGDPISIDINGTISDVLGPIEMQQGEKWEQEIGIIPQHIGDNQKVELLLFKDTETTVEDSLRLWINVQQRK